MKKTIFGIIMLLICEMSFGQNSVYWAPPYTGDLSKAYIGLSVLENGRIRIYKIPASQLLSNPIPQDNIKSLSIQDSTITINMISGKTYSAILPITKIQLTKPLMGINNNIFIDPVYLDSLLKK